MGRHSSDSEEDHRRSRRSGSRSHSPDKRRAHKKSKRKRASSPSYSESRHTSRSSSRSRDLVHRRHGRKKRSRSNSGSRERSVSRDHRKERSHRHHHSSRDRSTSRRHSRTRNSSHASDSRDSSSVSFNKSEKYEKSGGHDSSAAVALAKQKLEQALKAAAAADDTLRGHGVLASGSLSDQQHRAELISDIDRGDFVQTMFRSNRSEIPMPLGSSVDASHTGAIFSSARADMAAAVGGSAAASKAAAAAAADKDSLMHPNLYVGMQEKMESWRKKLHTWRRQKLSEQGGARS